MESSFLPVMFSSIKMIPSVDSMKRILQISPQILKLQIQGADNLALRLGYLPVLRRVFRAVGVRGPHILIEL